MRHGMTNRKLGRTSAHRNAMFRNQVTSMIQHERIITTLIKAKELRPIVEKMVTLGKTDSVHTRRQAARSIADEGALRRLFEEVSPRFVERPGGYTRIVKLGPRRGDGAEMAVLEFVDYELGSSNTGGDKGKGKGAAAKGGKKTKEPAADESGEKKGGKKVAKPAASEGARKSDDADEKPKKRKAKKTDEE